MIMSAIEKYDANNVYYPMDVNNCTNLAGIQILSVDDTVYKTKLDWGDGVTSNNSNTTSHTYSSLINKRLKIYNNPKKVKSLRFNLGVSGYSATNPTGTIINLELNPSILDYFPNAESLYFSHYCYANSDPAYQGKVIGEWAVKCGSKLKSLELLSCDYPSSNPLFNLDLIPSDSILEVLSLGGRYPAPSTRVTVSGNLNKIPPTCKVIDLGDDRASTVNSITGTIPSWVEEFSRTGRNTISGNVADLSPNLRYLLVQGSNTLKGILPVLKFVTYINVTGNNEIEGSLSSLGSSSVITVFIDGLNDISGSIPNFTECTTLTIRGFNRLSGSIPVLSKLLTLNIGGNNSLTDNVNLPNATSVTIAGNNTVTSLNLPKSNTVNISGQNALTGNLYTQISPNTSTILIAGRNTISTISGVFSNAVQVNIGGLNSLDGDVLDKFPNAPNIQIGGNNKMTYSSKTFPSTMLGIQLTGNAALDSTMVDRLLIDLNTYVTTWNGSKTIVIKGNSQPPGPLGLAAIESLIGKHVSISTN